MTRLTAAFGRLSTPLRALAGRGGATAGEPATVFGRRIGGAASKRKGRGLQDTPVPARAPERHRTIFISDTHLGTRGCKAALLVDFLRHNESDTLYLVGDIVDGWRLQRSWFWNDLHNQVIQEILRKAHEGTRVVYVPGNHDEALRDYVNLNFGGVDVVYEAVHTGGDGKRYLVIHGDHFDGVVKYAKWLAYFGDWAYVLSLQLNDAFNAVRRRMGLPYWSLSAYLKHKVKNAVEFISNYENAVARAARARGVDGVICGHIHHAEIKEIDGIRYLNDGDWVESCTALTEDQAGVMRIVRWTRFAHEQDAPRDAAHPAPAQAA